MGEPLHKQDGDATAPSPPPKTSFLQALSIILIATLLFFGLLEGALALFGVDPGLEKEDPFVGFAGHVPLFTQSKAPNGITILSTAQNKLAYFNPQMFPEEKVEETYRIFCLGGSTTYGRPYNDLTSFAGWLRELLPAADASRDWEVINAGGISYASYRVARLMEELVQYQPDLFVIYTGQNEFLEERSYRELRRVPEGIRSAVGLLARTRTWAMMNSALGSIGLTPEQGQPQQVQLTAEVHAILDHSTGPQSYQRDDGLRDSVLEHFQISLERMVDIARRAGAQVILVSPASNLKDCSPFKSEHSPGLGAEQRMRAEALLAAARTAIRNSDWTAALGDLDRAMGIDPRYAELHYLRGRALFALGRYEEARSAFENARDEDVCPLRALTPMRGMVAEAARKNNVPYVDFVDLVEKRVSSMAGHRIPGEESFLDHVHPTIEGHRLLATALLDTMIDAGIVHPAGSWGPAAVTAVDSRIRSRINPQFQVKALINLAKVLHWAGKFEDAGRLASQALAAAKGDPQLAAQASNVLIKLSKLQGDTETTDRIIRNAFAADPWNPMIHYHFGVRLLQDHKRQRGASHILFAAAFWDTGLTNSVLGLILYNNGYFELAYPFLEKALQQNPGDRITRRARDELRQQLGSAATGRSPAGIEVKRHPSGAPRAIYVQQPTVGGRPHGIYTEWHENGALKSYIEYVNGMPREAGMQWDDNGALQPLPDRPRTSPSGS